MKRAALVMLVFLVLLPGLQPVVEQAEAARSCNSCHRRYDPMLVTLESTASLTVNQSNPIRWVATAPWRNAWIEASMQWTATNTVEGNGSFVMWNGSLRGGASTTGYFTVTPIDVNQNVIVTSVVNVVAYYNHASSSKPDRQQEQITTTLQATVVESSMHFSPSLITWTQGEVQTIEVENIGTKELVDITTWASFGNITAGTSMVLADGTMASFNGSLPVGATIAFTWESATFIGRWAILQFNASDSNGGVYANEIYATMSWADVGIANTQLPASIGVMYGWFATAAVVAVMAQGFFKRKLDKKYGVKRKDKEVREILETPKERATYWWWVHTLLLGSILLFSAIHIIGLFLGDSMPSWNTGLVVGLVGLLLLGTLGYSGLFPKWSKKVIPKLSFRRGHAVLGILAAAFVLWHILLFL